MNDNPGSTSRIFTSEPMATRALAAEIRHNPAGLTTLLEKEFAGVAWGSLLSVRCEATEKLDIEVEFSVGGSVSKLGVEAKIDHELTEDQIDRELRVVGRLLVVVLDPHSVPPWLSAKPGIAVVSWEVLIAQFPGSRLTIQEVQSLRFAKTNVERKLRALDLVREPPEGLTVDVHRGGGGMPAVVIRSLPFPNGRELRAQIQIAGRGMPKEGTPVRVEYSIGVSVENSSLEYPDPTQAHEAPDWVVALRTLYERVLAGREDELRVSLRAPGRVAKGYGIHKLALARMYLPDALWLAKGYSDGWALGIKSTKMALDELDEIAGITVAVLQQWYVAETERQAQASPNI